MPYEFQLPTTSGLSFTAAFSSETHPSLPQVATVQRNVLRNVLKKYKRTPASAKASALSTVQAALNDYIPYLLAFDAGLSGKPVSGEDIDVSLRKEVEVQWRSTLSSTFVGRDPPRMNGRGLDFEIQFALTCLAYTHTLLARSSLLTLYASTSPSVDERVKIVQSATKHFLATNSIHVWLATCAMEIDASQAVIETLSQTQSALAALAMAEATLLAVLKDDPYPFVIAQSRDKNDKDWMIKAPEIPKVRAHLFARLCLSAYEHAGRAEAGLSGSGRVGTDVLEYLKDLRKTALAKAGRFFGIDAELAGETGKGIAWLKGAKAQLGFKDEGHEETTAFAKLRGLSKNIREKREDRKIEKGGQLGGAAGRLEELGVLGHLQTKWVKMNDTMNTQLIPPFEPLLANMPSGRDIHSSQPFVKPTLDEETLSRLRAPPERAGLLDDGQDIESSDDDDDRAKHSADIPGTFPGGSTQSTEPYY